ncbi:MAG: 3-oxoacyl-[acyl-carrier protein] reductase, partial [Thermoleophilaceae bacterium]|nr:3-oxoacyl-[acyl-carrier protein] reductase [Thermoleophilaceae bacterium]
MPTDRYQQLTQSAPGRFISKRLGLPQPTPLRRYEPGQQLLEGPALIGAAPGGRLLPAVKKVLKETGSEVLTGPQGEDQRFAALVFDASGISSSDGLTELYEFFHPLVKRIDKNGRLIVLGTPPALSGTPRQATAQRALEGFVRSLGKEIGQKGATANLVYVGPGGEDALDSTLRFYLSSKSAFVDAQGTNVGPGDATPPADWEKPLDGKVALVTGASRGIGASIAETLARDGAHVVLLDIPKQGEELAKVANRIGGSTLQADITDDDAPREIVDYLKDRHGGVDVFVHNAGITQDKTLGNMEEDKWNGVLAVNLTSQERINDALLESDALKPGGRIVSVSSMSGIAGNRGQSNYATTKAGVIGMVDAYAPVLGERGATINAVAPGFIETAMTAAM